MGRLFWPLALVAMFVIGWSARGVFQDGSPAVQGGEDSREASRTREAERLQAARARVRESVAAARPSGTMTSRPSDYSVASASPANRSFAAGVTDGGFPNRFAQGGGPPPSAVAPAQPQSRPPSGPQTMEAALDRFYRYLEATSAAEGRENWRRGRELTDELRGMGDVGAQALMQVLAAGTDTDERRAAARLLGTLKAGQALPLLRDIIENEQDVLLRRTAAQSVRQLQTPESMPVMERFLTNPTEDRFVRLSAAYGLAQYGRPIGISGLTQIFEESTADGRGRDLAFRGLTSLNDERPLPFMRQLVTQQVEPTYRLQAIRYLTVQGDRQALGQLQAVMNAPNEQPSIRDAAAQAYRALNAK